MHSSEFISRLHLCVNVFFVYSLVNDNNRMADNKWQQQQPQWCHGIPASSPHTHTLTQPDEIAQVPLVQVLRHVQTLSHWIIMNSIFWSFSIVWHLTLWPMPWTSDTHSHTLSHNLFHFKGALASLFPSFLCHSSRSCWWNLADIEIICPHAYNMVDMSSRQFENSSASAADNIVFYIASVHFMHMSRV